MLQSNSPLSIHPILSLASTPLFSSSIFFAFCIPTHFAPIHTPPLEKGRQGQSDELDPDDGEEDTEMIADT